MTAACCGVLLLVAACTAAPDVALAPLADEAACSTIDWPAEVSNLPAVATTPDHPSVSAWGNPPIIARCGLRAAAPTEDSCVDVDGVDWVVRQLTDGTAAVTYGREPAIEVLVPQEHGPVPLLLPAFGAAARSLPETGRHCS
ncbi:DUF3515 family protein [Intrasporangium sp.]|uniref:DUF3515 family protein n=1 Tax=Intrasporangium sp. TaxID=1925024 RepID=UPI002939D004|nr:DUF3515 family protein [Intrasporangium sp.]MDV3221502.1 DUF3515 family protein [Intrasporangium sp.]